MTINNGLVFGNIGTNGVIKTPNRKESLNNSIKHVIPVQGLTEQNEKIVNRYTQQYLNAGLKFNDAKRAARDQLELEKKLITKKSRRSSKARRARKTRKERKKTTN
jgi:hypothetical protein